MGFNESKIRQSDQPQNLLPSQDKFQSVHKYFTSMGFEGKAIWEAWMKTNQRQNLMLEELIKAQTLVNQNDSDKMDIQDDELVRKAIFSSLEKFNTDSKTEDDLRKDGMQVGLVNLGRTCYFNVVVQTLFSMKEVRKLIFGVDLNQVQFLTDQETEIKKQKYASLIAEFQKLFALLLHGKSSFQNPKKLFECLQNINEGNGFSIGDENDFWEFQNSALEFLEKAFFLLKSNVVIPSLKQGEQIPIEIENSNEIKKVNESSSSSNPIVDLFYGQLQEYIQYYDQQRELIRYNESIMRIVNLEVKHGDLYKALQASQEFIIPDYQVSNGLRSEAKVEIRIRKAPKILNFYINRLDFDKQKLCSVKLNDTFYFEDQINLDRFSVQEEVLGENYTPEQEAQLIKIERQIEKVEKMIRQINKSSERGQIIASFDEVLNFLEFQMQTDLNNFDDFVEEENFEVNLIKPEIDNEIPYLSQMEMHHSGWKEQLINSSSEHSLQQTIESLKLFKKEISNKLKSLQDRLDDLKKQKKTILELSRRSIYQLCSILMHEGGADSGHYFCYIKNGKQWTKLNDSLITQVTEENVFNEAYGNLGSNRNACSLIYREKQLNVIEEEESQIEELPAHLKEFVEQKNKELYDEIDLTIAKKTLEPLKKKLADGLNEKHTKIYECEQILKQMHNHDHPQLLVEEQIMKLIEVIKNQQESQSNFMLGLKGYEKYGARQTFIEMINCCDFSLIEQQLKDKNNINKAIHQLFVNLKFSPLKDIKESEQQELLALTNNYNLLLQSLTLMKEGIYKINESTTDYSDAVKSISNSLVNLKLGNKHIQENSIGFKAVEILGMTILRPLILKGCAMVDGLVQQENKKLLYIILQVMTVSSLTFYGSETLLIEQVKSNLHNTLYTNSKNERVFDSPLKQKFKTTIEQLASHKTNKITIQTIFGVHDNINNLNNNDNNDNNSNPNEARKEDLTTLGLNAFQSLKVTNHLKNQNLISLYLQLWVKFLNKIELNQKIVSKEERLDQEEVMYSLFK